MSKEITNDLINNFENDFNSSKANKIAARAAQENGIFKASQNLQTKIDLDPTFSIEPKTIWSLLDVQCFKHYASFNSKELQN